MLNLYRRLLALRRAHDALTLGTFALLPAPASVLAYERIYGDERVRVFLNLTPLAVALPWEGTPLLSTLMGSAEPGLLQPNEGLIIA